MLSCPGPEEIKQRKIMMYMTSGIDGVICDGNRRWPVPTVGWLCGTPRVLVDLRGGTSSASNNNPRGSIQSPRIGRKLSTPPQINSAPAGILIQVEDGRSNHWIPERKRGGSAASS